MTLSALMAQDLERVIFNPADLAETWQVTPWEVAPGYPVRVLLASAAEAAALGQARGHLDASVAWCLPAEVADLADGDLLTAPDGREYRVLEVVRRSGSAAQVWLVAR